MSRMLIKFSGKEKNWCCVDDLGEDLNWFKEWVIDNAHERIYEDDVREKEDKEDIFSSEMGKKSFCEYGHWVRDLIDIFDSKDYDNILEHTAEYNRFFATNIEEFTCLIEEDDLNELLERGLHIEK